MNSKLNAFKAPAVAALAGSLAFVLAGAAVSAAQPGVAEKGDGHGPVTPRTVVASGESDGYGRFELVASSDENGASCIGIRFPDAVPGSGLPSLAEGCGSDVENQVASLGDPKRGTLFFGRVDRATSKIAIKDRGDSGRTISVDALDGTDGRKYVVHPAGVTIRDFSATSIDAKGRALARVDPGARGDRPDGFAPAH